MKQFRKKLRSQIGESISETLVALLIAALSLTMLASMITSTVNMVDRSKEKMDQYYRANNALETLSSGETDPASLTFTMKENGMTVATFTIPIVYDKNETFSNTPIVAYRHS